MIGILSKVPYIGETVASSSAGAGASTFMVAYFVHKLMAPIRISVTLTITPIIVRVLRARGLIKP
jgi:outer membrane receptor for monomeric catechols